MPKVTLDLDDELFWIVEQFCASAGQSIEDTLRQLLIYPIYENNFYRDDCLFPQEEPLSGEEADSAFRSVVEPILAAARPENLREEAVIYALIRAAYGRALAFSAAKGWRDHAMYIAQGFCNELLYVERRKLEVEAAESL